MTAQSGKAENMTEKMGLVEVTLSVELHLQGSMMLQREALCKERGRDARLSSSYWTLVVVYIAGEVIHSPRLKRNNSQVELPLPKLNHLTLLFSTAHC
jgi:hypothetical protein